MPKKKFYIVAYRLFDQPDGRLLTDGAVELTWKDIDIEVYLEEPEARDRVRQLKLMNPGESFAIRIEEK